MMNWYWKVRIYDRNGRYWFGQIKTARELREIDTIQSFYQALTGGRMLIDGMSDQRDTNLADINDAFIGLWVTK